MEYATIGPYEIGTALTTRQGSMLPVSVGSNSALAPPLVWLEAYARIMRQKISVAIVWHCGLSYPAPRAWSRQAGGFDRLRGNQLTQGQGSGKLTAYKPSAARIDGRPGATCYRENCYGHCP